MKIFLSLIFFLFSHTIFGEEACSDKRVINLESKFVGEYRLDNYTIDNTCDFNHIQIFKNDELIFTEVIGQGYNNASQFLEGQSTVSKEYLWLEIFPGSRNWYTYGYYFGNDKIEPIVNNELKNCKFLEENKLLCRATTNRKFNPQNPKCTFEFRPDDIYEIEFNGMNFKKNIIEEEPITDECS